MNKSNSNQLSLATTSIPGQAPNLFGYKQFWAQRFGTAHELPMSMTEMEQQGWDSCDIILVTGDAYVDHPSFGMAVIGRVLEAQGFRVGIISQPDWTSAEDFKKLGRPNLFFGVTGGNMDSMVNRYTSDKKIRSNDAYTANVMGGNGQIVRLMYIHTVAGKPIKMYLSLLAVSKPVYDVLHTMIIGQIKFENRY